MKNIIFKGCATAIVTPFDENNNINFNEFSRLLDFQLKSNVSAIVVCGTTGEAATLSNGEREELIKFAIKRVNGNVPVIVGVRW